MSGLRNPRQARARSVSAVLLTALALSVAGCAGSTSDEPNTAGSASAIPGAVPTIGSATQGSIVISDLSIRRTGEKLQIAAVIKNSDASADELLSMSSQVTSTLTFSPPITIAGKGDVVWKGDDAVLTENARLPAGGTVALTLTFRRAGPVQVFSQFS